MDPRDSSPTGPAGDNDSRVGRRLREEGSGAVERELRRSKRDASCRRSSLRLRLIPATKRKQESEKKKLTFLRFHLFLISPRSLSQFPNRWSRLRPFRAFMI